MVEEDNTRFALGVKIPTENQQTCPFSLACHLMLQIEPTLKICRKVGTKASQLNLCTHVTLGNFFTNVRPFALGSPIIFLTIQLITSFFPAFDKFIFLCEEISAFNTFHKTFVAQLFIT